MNRQGERAVLAGGGKRTGGKNAVPQRPPLGAPRSWERQPRGPGLGCR